MSDNTLMIIDFMIRLSIVWLPVTICFILYSIYETALNIRKNKDNKINNNS